MIEVRIAGLNADATSGQPVILLVPLETQSDTDARMLPVWIGQPEATAILLALEDVELPRPMTHDLLAHLVEQLGFLVARVEVTRIDDGTYYAAIVLRGEDRTIVIDARPSDGIALAVRAHCPIMVADEVFEQASVSIRAIDEAEEEVERFRDFLDHVDPSDFTS